MPYVNVKITKDGVIAEQKARIVAEIIDTLVSVLGKEPEHTHIVIDEVAPENSGFASILTTEYRSRSPEKPRSVARPGTACGGGRGRFRRKLRANRV